MNFVLIVYCITKPVIAQLLLTIFKYFPLLPSIRTVIVIVVAAARTILSRLLFRLIRLIAVYRILISIYRLRRLYKKRRTSTSLIYTIANVMELIYYNLLFIKLKTPFIKYIINYLNIRINTIILNRKRRIVFRIFVLNIIILVENS